MKVLLTGGTGYVGAAVLKALIAHDHAVTALVRSDSSADAVSAAGATALKGDITDDAWLTTQLAAADATIHLASPGDETSPQIDSAIATAAVQAYSGTGKLYVHTGGVWVYGDGEQITEQSPFDAPDLVSWRADVENIVLDAGDLRAVVIVPALVYGHGGGLPNLLTTAPRDDNGALHLIGDGSQHWTAVHVDDLADLYVLAVESPDARGYYIAVGDDSPTVAELGSALGEIHPETAAETRARLGGLLADALLLDQQADATRARDELGWQPSGPSLKDELATGSYAS